MCKHCLLTFNVEHILKHVVVTIRPNNQKCVSGNKSETFGQGRHTYFFQLFFFLEFFMHFERHYAFQNA